MKQQMQPNYINNHRDRRTFTPSFKIKIVEQILANQADIRHVNDDKGTPIDPGNIQIWIDRYKLGKLTKKSKRIYVREAKPKATRRSNEGLININELTSLKMKILEIENNLLRSNFNVNPNNKIDSLMEKVLS